MVAVSMPYFAYSNEFVDDLNINNDEPTRNLRISKYWIMNPAWYFLESMNISIEDLFILLTSVGNIT